MCCIRYRVSIPGCDPHGTNVISRIHNAGVPITSVQPRKQMMSTSQPKSHRAERYKEMEQIAG